MRYVLADYIPFDDGTPILARKCVLSDLLPPDPSGLREWQRGWRETEILDESGWGKAIVLVNPAAYTPAERQAALSDSRVTLLPDIPLTTTLGELTRAERLFVRDLAESLGYTRDEWQVWTGRTDRDPRDLTLRQFLTRLATRRRRIEQADPNDPDNPNIRWRAGVNVTPTRVPEPPVAGGAFGDSATLVDGFDYGATDDLSNQNSDWTDVLNTMNVQTAGYAAPDSTFTRIRNNATTYGADTETYVTMYAGEGSGGFRSIYTRVQTDGDGYRASWEAASSDRTAIWRTDNFSGTKLGAYGSANPADGDKWGLESISSDHALYLEQGSGWTLDISRTDSTYSAAGGVAFDGAATTHQFDDLYAGEVGGGSTGTGTSMLTTGVGT